MHHTIFRLINLRTRNLLFLVLAIVILPLLMPGSVKAQTDYWLPISTDNAPEGRRSYRSVWTGTEVIIWGGNDIIYQPKFNTGGRYNPETDTWTTMSTVNVPVPLAWHAAVWTGEEMIVWGGDAGVGSQGIADGGRYNPSTDTWAPISNIGAPSPRWTHGYVWTGTEMIIWGGRVNNILNDFLNDGARYNPTTDTWTPMSTIGAPLPRASSYSMFWTGTEVIVWGGPGDSYVPDGARYNPSTDTWSPMNPGDPNAAWFSYAGVWTGEELITWGGKDRTTHTIYHTGQRYDPSTDTWTPISSLNAPFGSGRVAAWTGEEMFIWGGHDGTNYINNGGLYNPTSDTWRLTPLSNSPSPRGAVLPIWTGNEVFVWGGFFKDSAEYVYNTGARYYPFSNEPPISNAGVDQIAPIKTLITLDASASFDPESSNLTYVWSEDSANPEVSLLSDPHVIHPTFFPILPGTYQFSLIVNDGGLDSSPDFVEIIVLTPNESIENVIDLVSDFNLQTGIDNSLDAKFDSALNALDDINENNDAAAINSLQACINAIEAQRGNKISNEQADELINAILVILESLSYE